MDPMVQCGVDIPQTPRRCLLFPYFPFFSLHLVALSNLLQILIPIYRWQQLSKSAAGADKAEPSLTSHGQKCFTAWKRQQTARGFNGMYKEIHSLKRRGIFYYILLKSFGFDSRHIHGGGGGCWGRQVDFFMLLLAASSETFKKKKLHSLTVIVAGS